MVCTSLVDVTSHTQHLLVYDVVDPGDAATRDEQAAIEEKFAAKQAVAVRDALRRLCTRRSAAIPLLLVQVAGR